MRAWQAERHGISHAQAPMNFSIVPMAEVPAPSRSTDTRLERPAVLMVDDEAPLPAQLRRSSTRTATQALPHTALKPR